jgi:amino acid transporter
MNEPAKGEVERSRMGLTAWIMLAVLGWGILLATGSFLYGGTLPLVRAGIIFGVTVAFLGLWLAALALRRRRLASEDDGA